MYNHNCLARVTLGDIGKSHLLVEAELTYTHESSMYPGDSEYAYLDSVAATEIVGSDYAVLRSERPDWFAYLDECLDRRLRYSNILGLV